MTSSLPSISEIELRGLCKSFGELKANDQISFSVRKGTIHAVVGENGAGKSTAMKMLYGVYTPDAGEIFVRGVPRRWQNSHQAIASGIGMVHQHFMLAGPYSVLENVLLGAEFAATNIKNQANWFSKFFPIQKHAAIEKLNRLCEQNGFQKINWNSWVEDLPVGVQQRIEILKLLYRNAEILILDEPTAVLTPQETQDLFAQLRKMAKLGKTILIITHKLKEVMQLADEVTVFRSGKVVGHRNVLETSIEELASMMVGRKVCLQAEVPEAGPLREPVLEIINYSLFSPSGEKHSVRRLDHVSFTVRSGEIVGIAGVEGNGQSELLQALMRPKEYSARSRGSIKILGEVTLCGKSAKKTAAIKKLGVGFIPEDRHKEGLLLDATLEENFLLGLQKEFYFLKNGPLLRLCWEKIRARAEKAIETYDVRPRRLETRAGGLSGGNQQKLIIAREFERNPKLLIAAQPTRGVDVGAIEMIHQRILRARTEGAGILLVSSELDEILALSDRIFVMYAGKIVAECKRGEATEQALGFYMGGGHV